MKTTGNLGAGRKETATCAQEKISTGRRNAATYVRNVNSAAHIAPQIVEEEEKGTGTTNKTGDLTDPKAKKNSQTTEHLEGKALQEDFENKCRARSGEITKP